MLAAFSDLHVGGMLRQGVHARHIFVIKIVRALGMDLSRNPGSIEQGTDAGEFVGTDKQVNLGQALGELGLVTLRQATRHDDLQSWTILLERCRLQDGVDTLFFRCGDKPTSIDDDRISGGRLIGGFPAFAEHRSEHDFGVDSVTRAAKGNQVYLTRGRGDLCVHPRSGSLKR